MTAAEIPDLSRWVTPTWPLARVQRLAELWLAGALTTEIARELGASVNAVCAKRRKMRAVLAPRPSPVPPLPRWMRPTREARAAVAPELRARQSQERQQRRVRARARAEIAAARAWARVWLELARIGAP